MKLHLLTTAAAVAICLGAIGAILAGAPVQPVFLVGALLLLSLGLLAAALRGLNL